MKGKKLKLSLLCVVVLLFGCAGVAFGDWDEGDPYKMHYPQLPKEGGWDLATNSSPGTILADDWQCSETGPVRDIHFWASWRDNLVSTVDSFQISIYSDQPDPDGPGPAYSEPNELLWGPIEFRAEQNDFTVRSMPPDLQGWFDIWAPLNTIPQDHNQWCQINITDINNPFIQQQGNIYWLAISNVEVNDVNAELGWKESDQNFKDNAVRGIEVYGWEELTDPCTGTSMNLAFVITTEEEPNYAKPLVPHTKWSQPPVEIDPNSDVPTYCGWDEEAWRAYPSSAIWPIVADDFHCLGTMPVTSIHWWGSYIGWDGNEPPQSPSSGHEEWRIRFWSNVSQGMPVTFSWPEKMLWEIVIPEAKVQIDRAGRDDSPRPQDSNETCFQYYVELDPCEVFWQDDFNDQTMDDIYWISIEALDHNTIQGYHWGWKTRPWHWMDDAITMNVNDMNVGETVDPILNSITPIEYDGNSFDVSFELNTDPNYIKWEQHYTGIRHWPHYEDMRSMVDLQYPEDEALVIDDWRCLRRTPVTAIVWWGSYIGYGYEACNRGFVPVPPDSFTLTIFTDSPAGSDPCCPFSHPNEPILDYYAFEYDEVLVGYDKHPLGGPNEPVFRYSVRLPEEEWFHQPDYNEVFWLGVQATYNVTVPNYDWGWTNHQHVFNDNAVARYYDDVNEVWVWEELYDQTGASADMSFILFTDPNECSTCADYNCDALVNFVDYADFADDWRWVGPAGGYNNSDLDCNGVVDFKDLGILCMQWLNWLNSCP